MDPIGESILTLLLLSKEITNRGIILIRRYRGYSKALVVVQERVHQLEVQLSLLQNVQKTISEAGILPLQEEQALSKTLIKTCITFDSIRTFLAKHVNDRGTRARLKWAGKDEAEVEVWIEKLEYHFNGLNLVLNMFQMYACKLIEC